MSARVREGSPRGSMIKLSGSSGSSHGGVGSTGEVARLSSASNCECTAFRTSEGEVALVLSGLVILWRVEVALLGGEGRF